MEDAHRSAVAQSAGDTPSTGGEQPNPALPPIGILAGFDAASLEHLAPYGRYDRFPAGAEVMHEGMVQSRFYIIIGGQLEIVARGNEKDLRLHVAEPGECLGEVNLLEPGPASATVRALQDSILWSMDNAELRRYLTEHVGGCGALLIGITSCLSQRLRQANDLIRQHHVMPEKAPASERAITADDAPVALGFFERLKQSMSRTDKVRISTEIKM